MPRVHLIHLRSVVGKTPQAFQLVTAVKGRGIERRESVSKRSVFNWDICGEHKVYFIDTLRFNFRRFFRDDEPKTAVVLEGITPELLVDKRFSVGQAVFDSGSLTEDGVIVNIVKTGHFFVYDHLEID